eukprot:tig00020902_g14975.t1
MTNLVTLDSTTGAHTRLYLVMPPFIASFGAGGGITLETQINVAPLGRDANGTEITAHPDGIPAPLFELAAATHRIAVLLDPDLTVRVEVSDGNGPAVSVSAGGDGDVAPRLERAFWSHIAVTFSASSSDQSEVKIYINGVQSNFTSSSIVPVSQASYNYSRNFFASSDSPDLAAAQTAFSATGIRVWSRELLGCEFELLRTVECTGPVPRLVVNHPFIQFPQGSELINEAIYLNKNLPSLIQGMAPTYLSIEKITDGDPVYLMGPAVFLRVTALNAYRAPLTVSGSMITLEGNGTGDAPFKCPVLPLQNIQKLASSWVVPFFCEKPYTGRVEVVSNIPLVSPFVFYVKFFPRIIEIEALGALQDPVSKVWVLESGKTYELKFKLQTTSGLPVLALASDLKLIHFGPLIPLPPGSRLQPSTPAGKEFGLSDFFTMTVTPTVYGEGSIMGYSRQKVKGGRWRYQLYGSIEQWRLYFAETGDANVVLPPGSTANLVAVPYQFGAPTLASLRPGDGLLVDSSSFLGNTSFALYPLAGLQWTISFAVPVSSIGVATITSSPAPFGDARVYITEWPQSAEIVPDEGLLMGSQTGIYAYYARSAVPVSVVPRARGHPTYNVPSSLSLRGSGVLDPYAISPLYSLWNVHGYSNLFVGSMSMPNVTGRGSVLCLPRLIRPYTFTVVEYPEEIPIATPVGLLGEYSFRVNSSIKITITPRKWGAKALTASSTVLLTAGGAQPASLLPVLPISIAISWTLDLEFPPVGGLGSLLARPGTSPPFSFAIVESPDEVELVLSAIVEHVRAGVGAFGIDSAPAFVYSWARSASGEPLKMTCTLVPRLLGRVVWAHRSDLSWFASGVLSNADLGPIGSATFGASSGFAVEISLPGKTGFAHIGSDPPPARSGPANATVAIADVATRIELNSSEPSFAGPVFWRGSVIAFTLVPYRSSERIYTLSSILSVSLVGVQGSVSARFPDFADVFSFSVETNGGSGPSSVVYEPAPPVATGPQHAFTFTVIDTPSAGKLECPPTLIWAGSPPLECTVTLLVNGSEFEASPRPVWVLPSHVSLNVSESAENATLALPSSGSSSHAGTASTFVALVGALADPHPTSGEVRIYILAIRSMPIRVVLRAHSMSY